MIGLMGATHSKPMPARGLYLLTPDDADDARLLARLAPLLPHCALLQHRAKALDAPARERQARALLALCRRHGVPLVINDDAALAARIAADGVHLGEDDGAIAAARELLGERAIIGASCYDDLQRAREALAQGADYVAFGALFPSPTKPGARRATPGLLRQARTLGHPVVAIGGITPDNARQAIDAGADLIAVIGGVFDAPDPTAAAQACAAAFQQET